MKFNRDLLKSNSSRNYVKLQSGESISGIFRGDPVDYRIHWANGKSQPCLDFDCPLCKAGDTSKLRWKMNFIQADGGALVPKIFDMTKKTFELIVALADSGYEIDKTKVKVTRKGTGTTTTYEIVPLPKAEVSPELEAMLASIKPFDLTTKNQD